MATVKSIQFRFKSPPVSLTTPTSQSLFTNIEIGNTPQFTVVLEHTASATSGSYLGSIINPEAKYADLRFIHEGLADSASISLPFIDGGWWSVMVTQEELTTNEYTYIIYASNKVYGGVDGNTVGFEASASFSGSLDWTTAGNSYFPGSGSITITRGTYTPFTGSLQELRYFTTTIRKPIFKDFVQNSNSIEGSSGMLFRAALGGELYTHSSSIHPKSSIFNSTPSFTTGNTFTIVSGSFQPNYETTLVDQIEGGVRNRVSNKIKKQNLILPPSSSIYSNIPANTVLAAGISIQQRLEVSESYTRNVNYVEVALSPQNEINDDINATYGYINIGEYIGDPRYISLPLTSYPDLDNLRDSYFTKYNSNYNYNDYVRLSKYYDNAIFQMIKDYVPVRAGLATGVVLKQHLLERNRVRPAQVSYLNLTLSGSIKPQSRNYTAGTIEILTAGPGGSVNSLINTNQAWSASYKTPAGLISQIESSQYEFYNGEYSGSTVLAQASHSINTQPLLNNVETNRTSTLYQDIDYSYNATTPVNIDLILSGSATAATVPDSNYTGLRSITPRYLGSKNIGTINYSQSFSTESVAPGYPVDNFTPWFAHFNGINNSAELGYGVGGNVNVTELINAETKDRILMTSVNENIDFLGQLFKQGDRPSIVPVGVGIILEGAVEVEAAGTLYQTILTKSGSAADGNLGNFYPSGALSFGYAGFNTANSASGWFNGVAFSQSIEPNGNLTDFDEITGPLEPGDLEVVVDEIDGVSDEWEPTAATTMNSMSKLTPYDFGDLDPTSPGNILPGWLFMLSIPEGHVNRASTVQSLGDMYIYNKKTGLLSQDPLSMTENTYFPIEVTDFVRFGTLVSSSMDSSIRNGSTQQSSIESLRTIKTVTSGTLVGGSSVDLLSQIPSDVMSSFPDPLDPQNFRVVRKIPTEFYILVKSKPAGFTGEGLLLPHNFNPKYNAKRVAQELGVIKMV